MFSTGKYNTVDKYFTSSTGVDSYYNRTILLLGADGTTGLDNSTYVDKSASNLVLARGASQNAQGAFSPYSPAGWSISFNGTTDYVSVPNINFSTNNFTIEGWFYFKDIVNNSVLWGSDNGAGGNPKFGMYVTSSALNVDINGTIIISLPMSTYFTTNTWYHIAFVRTGTGTTGVSVYINGVFIVSPSNYSVGDLSGITAPFNVGYLGETLAFFNGFISNFRVLNGTAAYTGTGTFTPSTTTLTAIANTALLLNGNRFADFSGSNKVVTVTGSPWVIPYSPFAPSTAYSPASHGGSLYSSTATDYVGSTLATMANTQYMLALGDGDFTVEGWFYPLSATTTAQYVFSNNSSDGNSRGIRVALYNAANNPGVLVLYGAGNNPTVLSSRPAYTNSWIHVAVSRQNGVFRVFQDGRLVASASDTTNYNVPAFTVGNQIYARNTAFVGYSTDIRITKQALYTSNFTVPGSPLQPVSYTSKYDQSQYYVCQFQGGTRSIPLGVSNPFGYDANIRTQAFTYNNSTLETNGLNVTTQFCLECFVYFNSSLDKYPGDAYTLGVFSWPGYNVNALQIRFFSDIIEISNAGYYSFITPTNYFKLQPGRWYHFAFIGNTTNYVAVDGIVYSTGRTGGSGGYTENGVWNIIKAVGGFDGYIRDYRVTTGTTVYSTTGNFPRPRMPLSSVVSGGTVQALFFNGPTISDATGNSTNLTLYGNSRGNPTMVPNLGGTTNTIFTQQSPTVACLNFNNAGVYDYTGKNNVFNGATTNTAFPTVSNAATGLAGSNQINWSTATNWLRIPNSPMWDFGSGEWMIDFWITPVSVTTAQTIFAKKTATTGFGPVQIDISTTGKIVVKISTNGTATTQTLTTTTSLVVNTLTYVAVYKYFDGTNYRITCAINGASAGGALSGAGNLTVVANTADVTIGCQAATTTASQVLVAGTYLDEFRVTRSPRGYTYTSFPPTPSKLPGNQ